MAMERLKRYLERKALDRCRRKEEDHSRYAQLVSHAEMDGQILRVVHYGILERITR